MTTLRDLLRDVIVDHRIADAEIDEKAEESLLVTICDEVQDFMLRNLSS